MTQATDVPAPVELLLAFANSVDHELGTDDLSTPGDLGAWLHRHDLLVASEVSDAGAADLALALRLRNGLHAALVRNHDADDDAEGLTEVAAELPLRLSSAGGVPVLEPVDAGVRGALGQVLVAVMAAAADGSWARLKVCASSECAWAYYDASRNRSRAWCEWGCGNRIKTRNYRAPARVVLRSAEKPSAVSATRRSTRDFECAPSDQTRSAGLGGTLQSDVLSARRRAGPRAAGHTGQ